MMRCDPAVLWTLVEQSQEPTSDVIALFDHVERCGQCQATLRSIGGNETWWRDVQHWLSSEQPGPESAAPPAPTASLSAADLSFLQPAAHPEMLGRMGRYDIEGVIGRGGMGIVFRGFDSDLCRCVAIKTLSPRYGCDADARQRFAREAQAAASVVHENVIPIFNVQADHDPPFLVMPYVAGATLERFVKQHGRPDAITVLRIARQIADGLRAAHQQDLIHRDIKPGNILVTENVHRVWITDFGLARAVDDATLTHTGVIAGTPQFMSPEQSRGQRLDARSDLFSFGALLYFLSTGRPPFEADSTLAVLHQVVSTDPPSLVQLRPDLPPAFTALVDDLLRKQPEQRPRDAGDVCQRIAMAVAQNNSGVTIHRVRRRRRARRWAGTATAALVLVAASLASLPWLRQTDSKPAAGVQHSAAADIPPARSRLLAATVYEVDRQLTHPEADAAVGRLAHMIRLTQQSTAFPQVQPDLRRDPTANGRGPVALVAASLNRLTVPDAQAWTPVAADPTRQLAEEVQRLGRQLGRLPPAPDLLPPGGSDR